MSLIFLPDCRSTTETVPDASFETRPRCWRGMVAAPNGYPPTGTRRTVSLARSTIAAESERFSATSSRRPSAVTESFMGQFEGDAGSPARGGGNA
jgi:hypothetical protein